jgi:hypothetical protein
MKLTQEQLEAIRQRAEHATPGPWKEDDVTGALVSDIGEDVAVFDAGPYIYAHDRTEANMEFIAHARTDIPALLEHIAELEAELARLKDALINTERKGIVRAYYRQVHERFSKSPDGSFEEEYCSGIMSGIKTTLDLLGITIEGVND